MPANSTNFTTCCYANINGVGGVTVQDIFEFLTCYFSNNILCADCDGNGILTPNDLFCFLAAFFSGVKPLQPQAGVGAAADEQRLALDPAGGGLRLVEAGDEERHVRPQSFEK